MKRFYAFTYKLGITKILFICFLVGIGFGTLVANFFKSFYLEDFFAFNESVLATLSSENYNRFIISEMAFVSHMKEFGLLCLLATTMIGVPSFMIHSGYKGFCVGFLVSTATMRYGAQGIAFFLAYLMPQYIILIPLYIITYLKGYEVNYKLYATPETGRVKLTKLIPWLLALVVLLVAASALEGYFNTSLLSYIMIKLQ